MGASERVVVLMSPDEKQSLEQKAVMAGRISAGELVRRAVDAYDGNASKEAVELRDLLDFFTVFHRDTLDMLGETERKLDETLAYLKKSGRQAE